MQPSVERALAALPRDRTPEPSGYLGVSDGAEAILLSPPFYQQAPTELSFKYRSQDASVRWLEVLVSVNGQLPENLWYAFNLF